MNLMRSVSFIEVTGLESRVRLENRGRPGPCPRDRLMIDLLPISEEQCSFRCTRLTKLKLLEKRENSCARDERKTSRKTESERERERRDREKNTAAAHVRRGENVRSGTRGLRNGKVI